MESTATWEEWEFCNDDGFVFKRRKRRRVDPGADSARRAPPSSVADPERVRREGKKKSLLKIRARYQAEIEQWELLSSTLRATEESTRQLQQQQDQRLEEHEQREQTASLGGSEGSENASGSLVDELLLQAEAQKAIIRDVSILCDTAEAMCNEEEELITRSLLDLPIWGSPRELMRSLCDP